MKFFAAKAMLSQRRVSNKYEKKRSSLFFLFIARIISIIMGKKVVSKNK